MNQEVDRRTEVMNAITPICEGLGIKDFDYIVVSEEHNECLKLNNTYINCACNSISEIVDEIIGYLLVKWYCKNRSLGAFETQTLNVVKRYWAKESK